MKRGLMVLAMVLLVSGTVSAAPFQNGSFENFTCTVPSGSFAILTAGDTCLTGWTISYTNVKLVEYGYWDASDGKFSIDLDGTDASSVEQTFDTIPGAQYIVSFDMAGNPNQTFGPIRHMRVVATGASYQEYSFDTTGKSPTNMGWTTMQYIFQAGASSTTLRFYSADDGQAYGPALDNVRVENRNIPTMNEWGMIIFMVFAGIVSVYYLRRQRRTES